MRAKRRKLSHHVSRIRDVLMFQSLRFNIIPKLKHANGIIAIHHCISESHWNMFQCTEQAQTAQNQRNEKCHELCLLKHNEKVGSCYMAFWFRFHPFPIDVWSHSFFFSERQTDSVANLLSQTACDKWFDIWRWNSAHFKFIASSNRFPNSNPESYLAVYLHRLQIDICLFFRFLLSTPIVAQRMKMGWNGVVSPLRSKCIVVSFVSCACFVEIHNK